MVLKLMSMTDPLVTEGLAHKLTPKQTKTMKVRSTIPIAFLLTEQEYIPLAIEIDCDNSKETHYIDKSHSSYKGLPY
jgi:hypothetical protein